MSSRSSRRRLPPLIVVGHRSSLTVVRVARPPAVGHPQPPSATRSGSARSFRSTATRRASRRRSSRASRPPPTSSTPTAASTAGGSSSTYATSSPARDAPAVMAALKADGVSVVVGAYSSDLSIAASQAASDAGLVYWEAGAVADRLTGRGLPLVFRVGASGTQPRLELGRVRREPSSRRGSRKTPSQLRVAIVAANDDYARSVADAAAATAEAAGHAGRRPRDLRPDVPGLARRVMSRSSAIARADVIILASHIPDGVAFRQAMLAANLRVGALIGSTMAECDPDFAGDLGPDAVGIFASDRPTGGFQPSALDPAARALYDRFAAAWAARGARVERVRSATAPSEPAAGAARIHDLGTDRGRLGRGRSERGGAVGLLRRLGAVPRRAASRGRIRFARRLGRRGGRPIDRPPDRVPAERCRPPLLGGSGDARPERTSCGRHLAVAGRSVLHVRLAADIPDRRRSVSSPWTDDRDRPAVRPGRIARPAIILGGLTAIVGLRWAATVDGAAGAVTRSGWSSGSCLVAIASRRRLAPGAGAPVVGRDRRRRWPRSSSPSRS